MSILSLSRPAPTSALLRNIAEQIRMGLPHEKERLADSDKNLAFYQGDFKRFPVRTMTAGGDASRFPRYTLAMQRIVNVLTANLYKDGPKRILPENEPATEWLNAVYRANCADAFWQQADRFAAVGDVAMFGVTPTTDPRKPVRLHLYDSSQFCTWTDPDDQLQIQAIAVLDKYNAQRRLRLWTDETVQTWLTRESKAGDTAGGTAYEFRNEKPNPFGFLPFSFVHWDMPVSDWWCHGPGTFLRNMNDGMNFALTTNFDAIRYNLVPITTVKNAPPGWTPKSPKEPGDVWLLPAFVDAGGDKLATAEVENLQSDSSFVAASWDDLQNYLDHVLEMTGVPPATVRMVQDSVRSGVSIIAEQAPLILWAESRQRPYAFYEDELARLVLRMGASHLGGQEDLELQATASDLETASADPKLTLNWGRMYPDMPGAEQDASDGFLYEMRMASRKSILMRRNKWTEEETDEYLIKIAKDLIWEKKLFAPLDPALDANGQPVTPGVEGENVPPEKEKPEPVEGETVNEES